MPFNIKEIRYYYAFNLFFSLILWYPVFYQIMQDSGLDAQTIFKLQSLYYLSHLLVEAPSGYLADRFGSIFAMRHNIYFYGKTKLHFTFYHYGFCKSYDYWE